MTTADLKQPDIQGHRARLEARKVTAESMIEHHKGEQSRHGQLIIDYQLELSDINRTLAALADWHGE